MTQWEYRKGLHDLGNGNWAWLQPDGGWGWSNAGLVTDGEESLLVDTLFDLRSTQEMLDAMRDASPAASHIGTMVNTHNNGDHTHGNQLVNGAKIVGTRTLRDDMDEFPPDRFAMLMQNWQAFGEAGAFLHEVMGRKFDFTGIRTTPPTHTFDGEITLKVGDKDVRLVDVGPAHTRSDVIAYVPDDGIVYTGDILFHGGHPVVWAGPVSNWMRACDLILGWDADVIVPGHGPIADKKALRDLRSYFEYLTIESRKRFDAGMDVETAARDISLTPFGGWIDDERIVVNIHSLYRDFAGETKPLTEPDIIKLWTMMGRLYNERKAARTCACGHQH